MSAEPSQEVKCWSGPLREPFRQDLEAKAVQNDSQRVVAWSSLVRMEQTARPYL